MPRSVACVVCMLRRVSARPNRELEEVENRIDFMGSFAFGGCRQLVRGRGSPCGDPSCFPDTVVCRTFILTLLPTSPLPRRGRP